MARTGAVSGSVATRRAQIAWATAIPVVPSNPAVVGGRIFFSENQGAVACHDARSGAQIWRRTLPASFSVTPPTVVGGRVFLTRFYSSTSETMALNAVDGTTIWSSPVVAQWQNYGAPCVIDGRVFTGGGWGGGLYGFDQATGAQLFFNSSLPQADRWAASATGAGLLTWIQGSVRRHNVATGVVERTVTLDSTSDYFARDKWAAVTSDRAVVVSLTGIYSVHPTTLARQWTVSGSNYLASALIQGDSVFVMSSTGFERRSAATGALLASTTGIGDLSSTNSPLVTDDAVIISKSGYNADWEPGSTIILDRTTLAVRQRLPFGGKVVAADGALFIAEAGPPRLVRLDLLDATLDPAVSIDVVKNGVPLVEGSSTSGDLDVTVTINNAIGQHVQVYGNFVVLQSMDHDEMIETSPWVTTLRVDSRRFFDGENLLSVHVHPHNGHEGRHTTDFTFATFRLTTANGLPAPSGDRLLPQFRPTDYHGIGARVSSGAGWPIIRGGGELIDDGVTYGVDQFPKSPGPIQIVSHLGTSVLGRSRWHLQNPPFGDLQLIDGVDARPFLAAQPTLARVVYFFTDRAGRANYYHETIALPALTPADEQAIPVPLMHGHILNVHDGDHLVADDNDGFTAWIKVVSPLPHAVRYRSLTLWIGNRAVAVRSLQPFIDAMPVGGTSFLIPVIVPANEIRGLLAAHDTNESSSAFAVWMDFNQGNPDVQIDTPNMANGEHLHLNSVRLASTPWPWGAPTVSIVSPYETEVIASQPFYLRYRTWGNLTGVTRALVAIDGGAAVSDPGFDGEMALPTLSRGAHSVTVTLANAAGVPLSGAGASIQVDFVVPNSAPVGRSDAWQTAVGVTLTVPAASGVLANDYDSDGDPLSASVITPPQHGSLILAASGALTYVPVTGYSGDDSFTYRISDGTVSTSPVTVILFVGSNGPTGVAGPWTTLGNGPAHTGVVVGRLLGRQPVERWSYQPSIPGELLHPAIAAGRVHTGISTYVSAGMCAVTLDLASGAQRWRRDFADGFSLNPPTVDGGRVYLQRGNHSEDTQLWSLDAATGQVVWQAPFGAQWERYLAPCVADGKVFINGGGYGGMYGFRQSDGAQLFFVQLDQVHGWTPTWLDGRLYSQAGSNLRAHSPVDGGVMAHATRIYGQLPPVAADGKLVVRDSVDLAAYDAATLQRRWRISEAGRFTAMPAVAGGLVYAPLMAGGMEVRSLNDGSLQRSVVFPGTAVGQPIVSDDMVIVASDSVTYGLDRTTWQTRWTLPVGGLLSLGQDHLCVTGSVRLVCYHLPRGNAAPVAVADNMSATEDVPFTITSAALLANDSDADGNALSVRVLTQPTRGTLTVVSGGYLYQPAADAFGPDSFTYVAGDGLLESKSATVTITVTPVEDPQVSYKPGLLAEFFDYTTALTAIPNLTGRTPDVIRTDAQIAYASVTTAWAGLPSTMSDTFASRHSGWLKVDTAGSYTLFVSSDDGSRVFLDGALVINNDGVHLMQERSATRTLTVGYHRLQVEFFEGTSGAGLEFRWSGPGISKQLVPASALWQAGDPPLYQSGLRAEFFDYTTSLSVIPDLSARTPGVVRTDARIAYASVGTAWTGLPTTMTDTFASRHTGWLKVDTAGSYTLFVSSDDGSRVYLNGALVINNDGLHGMQERSGTLTLASGFHHLRVEFFEGTGGAGLEFRWSGPGITKQLVPASALWQSPTGVLGVPLPWVTADIGALGVVGSANGNGADFSITGGGADIWGSADAFRFVYRPLTVNGELIARVAALQNTNTWAKAGVMVRASTAANSVNAFMAITPGNGATFQSRSTTGGTSTSVVSSGKVAPYWVRLVRNGTSVTGWISPDGVTWTQVGAAVTIPLGATPVIGLGVTGHNNAVRALTIFDQVLLIPYAGG